MTVGEFIDKCDAIEALIAVIVNPETSPGAKQSAEYKVLDLTARLIRMGYTIPKPAWDGTGL